ncbi:MAG: hypothetical protein EPN47_01670 [Acidobacteria bacterium]|nr:MAG: hypothetical protein EPN47_01670 [Acidobacteriota bacterium]
MKQVIYESGELSKSGQHQKALALLDDLIARAAQENRATWIRILCRHAAVISDHAGEIELAKKYHGRVLAESPDDSMSLYSLADLSSREGNSDVAKGYAARCYEVCMRQGASEDRAVIELLLQRWPELKPSERK